jgi:hypothetical protein
MNNHDPKWCFVNPASKAYKPDVRARRIEQAKKRGVVLPDHLADVNPAPINMVSPPQTIVDDLVGALRLVGHLSEE